MGPCDGLCGFPGPRPPFLFVQLALTDTNTNIHVHGTFHTSLQILEETQKANKIGDDFPLLPDCYSKRKRKEKKCVNAMTLLTVHVSEKSRVCIGGRDTYSKQYILFLNGEYQHKTSFYREFCIMGLHYKVCESTVCLLVNTS